MKSGERKPFIRAFEFDFCGEGLSKVADGASENYKELRPPDGQDHHVLAWSPMCSTVLTDTPDHLAGALPGEIGLR